MTQGNAARRRLVSKRKQIMGLEAQRVPACHRWHPTLWAVCLHNTHPSSHPQPVGGSANDFTTRQACSLVAINAGCTAGGRQLVLRAGPVQVGGSVAAPVRAVGDHACNLKALEAQFSTKTVHPASVGSCAASVWSIAGPDRQLSY